MDYEKFVLDIAVKQINAHTDLKISYKLEKKGRSFKTLQFLINTQAISKALPIIEGHQFISYEGLTEQQFTNARINLEKWDIKRPAIVNQIMGSVEHIKEVNKFAHQLQTGKIKVEKNIAGYLLTKLGIKM